MARFRMKASGMGRWGNSYYSEKALENQVKRRYEAKVQKKARRKVVDRALKKRWYRIWSNIVLIMFVVLIVTFFIYPLQSLVAFIVLSIIYLTMTDMAANGK